MNETLRRLFERRATVWNDYQEILDRGNTEDGWSAEDREALDRAEAELTTLSDDIQRAQRSETVRAAVESVEQPPPAAGGGTAVEVRTDQDAYADAFWNGMRYGMSSLDAEQRQTLAQHIIPAQELRALGVGTDAGGGYLVPPGFEARLVETLKAYGPMVDLAEVVTTSTGNSIEWPTVDDTGNKGAILAENTQVTEQDVAFGTKTLDAYMYTSKLVRVSLQLMQDSAFDLEDYLERALGERIGRIVNEHFTTGTGTAQPDGIVTSATVGVTLPVGNTVTVTVDGIIDLIHSVDPAYRTADAVFMMNDATLKGVRKLKDADGRPIWEPSVQADQPDRLIGYGLRINQDMAVPAASAKTIVFGDIRAAYIARRVQGTAVLTLRERYADFLQVGLLGFARWDGTLSVAGAARVLQQSAT